MPGESATIARQVSVLKEVHADIAAKHFDEKTMTLDIMEKGDFGAAATKMLAQDVEGKYIKVQAHTDGNPNAGIPVSESGVGAIFPRAGSQERNDLKFRSKMLVTANGLTDQILSRTKNDVDSVMRTAAAEMEGMISNTRRQENKWAIGDGSALLATTGATGFDYSAGTVEVDSAVGFKVGQEIVLRTKQGGAIAGTTNWPTTGGVPHPMKITDVDTSTNLLTVVDGITGLAININSGSDVTATHGVYPYDAQGNAPWGLDIITSTANPSAHGFDPASAGTDDVGISNNFGATDRTANTWWKAVDNVNLAGVALDVNTHLIPLEATFLERDDTPRGEHGIFVLSDYQRYCNIIQQLEVAKRTVDRRKITANQWDVVKSGMFTFGYDTQVAAGTYYFFDPESIFRLVLTPWHVDETGGSEWERVQSAIGRPTPTRRRDMIKECQTLVNSCRLATKYTNAA